METAEEYVKPFRQNGRRFGAFITNFEEISHIVSVFSLLTLGRA